jgi:hypothetical protein
MYVEPAQAHFSGEGDARMNERRRCGEKGMANQKPFVFNDEAIHEYARLIGNFSVITGLFSVRMVAFEARNSTR